MNAVQRATDLFEPAEIERLRGVSDGRAWWSIVHCWGVILATWIAVAIWTNPLTIALGIVIIGTRQLGLFVIAHDGAHYTLFKNRKLNDWVCEWILERPLTGGSIDAYRKYHLQHHAFTQQAEDPDLHLSQAFPITRASFRRKMIRDLTGQTGWKQYGALVRAALEGDTLAERLRTFARRLGPNLLINLVFFAGFAAAGVWYLYFLLWWVPAFTWNRFVTRLRNIGEHAAVPDNDDRLLNTRTVEAAWWERAFVAPYNVCYHLEHHLIVNCPLYRLREAHQMLLDKGLRERMEIKASYRDVLRAAVPA